jgi:hypothetical protein
MSHSVSLPRKLQLAIREQLNVPSGRTGGHRGVVSLKSAARMSSLRLPGKVFDSHLGSAEAGAGNPEPARLLFRISIVHFECPRRVGRRAAVVMGKRYDGDDTENCNQNQQTIDHPTHPTRGRLQSGTQSWRYNAVHFLIVQERRRFEA